MNTRSNHSRRANALDRLDRIRFATAVAAVGGTAAFGALAAITWSGNPAPAAAGQLTNDGVTVGPGLRDDQVVDPGLGDGSGTDPGSNAVVPQQPQADSGFGQLAPVTLQPRSGSGRAHVSSGGS